MRILRHSDIGFTVPDEASRQRYNQGERPFCPHCRQRANWGYGVKAWVHLEPKDADACGQSVGDAAWIPVKR